MNKQTIKLILGAALLFTASKASAQQPRYIHMETYCWDDADGDRTFDCNDDDGRNLGTLYDYPIPEFDTSDPNAWPTMPHNFSGQAHFLPGDHARCAEYIRTQTKYVGAEDDDILTLCFANLTWIAPLGIAGGTGDYNFGHPIEYGREKAEGDGGVIGILADVNSITCGCYFRDDSFGSGD